MKKTPFGKNSINKEWAKKVTLEKFCEQLSPHYPLEFVKEEWYLINGIEQSKEVETPPAFVSKTLDNGKPGINTKKVEIVKSRRNNRRNTRQ
jgi:hypothetical protein